MGSPETEKSHRTVGINLLWLVPGKVGGSQEYTLRLLAQLAEVDLSFKVRIYVLESLVSHLQNVADKFELVVLPAKISQQAQRSKGLRIVLENSWLCWVSRNDQLVHHAGGVVPLIRKAKPIVTIHDLQPLEMARNFSFLKRRWLAIMLPLTARSAKHVVCPSRFSADKVVQLLNVAGDKVTVVPHPVTASMVSAKTSLPVAGFDVAKFGKFLLYPAIMYKHKRHIDVVRALSQLGQQFGELSIVFTGGHGPEFDTVMDEVKILRLEHRVFYLGRIPAAQLQNLYQNAVALVFPSVYEGFGNPIVEAMANGCPTILSNAGSLPEVAGGAGEVFDGENSSALVDAIKKVLTEPGLADELAAKGLARIDVLASDHPGQTLANLYTAQTHDQLPQLVNRSSASG